MKPNTIPRIPRIPCKEKKCILYSTCVIKTEIKCEHLLNYFRIIDDGDDTASTWDIIKRDFPKLVFIEPSKFGYKAGDCGEIKILNDVKPFPCIDEKCLKYPACASKTEIECSILNTLFCYMYDNLNQQQMWSHVRKYFPKLRQVAASGRPFNNNKRSFTIAGHNL